MLSRLPGTRSIGRFQSLGPDLSSTVAIAKIYQGGSKHLVGGCIIRVQPNYIPQSFRSLSPACKLRVFRGKPVPHHDFIRLLVQHFLENLYPRFRHTNVPPHSYLKATSIRSATTFVKVIGGSRTSARPSSVDSHKAGDQPINKGNWRGTRDPSPQNH